MAKVEDEGLGPKLEVLLDDLFVRPVQEVLEEPVPAWTTLQNLKILESRFVGGLHPETDWSVALDVSIQFLDHLRWYDVPALAEAISREDMAMFQEYVRLVFTTEGDQARAILCTRWNQLKVTIWECIAAEIGLESTIDGLAHVSRTTRCSDPALTISIGPPQTS